MRARLVVVEGDARPEFMELTPEQAYTLGRSRDNSIVLRDEHSSRLHARIYFENGRWNVRDFGLNGTRVDGERIKNESELDHGQEIRIGDTRLRFTHEDGGSTSLNATINASSSSMSRASTKFFEKIADPPSSVLMTSTNRLQADDLTTLCQFMAAAVEDHNPHDLVRRALQLLLHETQATLVGYLSMDPTDPLPKLVMPEKAQVDAQLSRQLTRKVQRDGKTVWLGTDLGDTRPNDSLMPFSDALCVPLKASGLALGALHVYRGNHFFAERDVRFAEALAGYLAGSLHVLRIRRNLEAENSRLRGHSNAAEELVGDSPAMVNLRQLIARAAPQPYTVLVRGESGSGKELVALALHRQSVRSEGPLVVVNCAAIAPSLLEAELFGYVKGAFSGADRNHPGLFQQADEGTLFLDEIGELSFECQAKLLRVIEGKSFRPVGATNDIKTDVRIVAATHRDLDEEVRKGKFQQALFFRLQVIQIPVPPLRDHAEDIPFLVQYFLERLANRLARPVKLTPAALNKLQAYSWPGNVRQLRAILESAVVMTDSDTLDACALHLATDTAREMPPSLNLDDLETWAINHALKHTNNNVTQAAKLLGIARDTLHTKIKKKNLDRPLTD